MIESLMQMCDPYVSSRLKTYRQTIEKSLGPNFLQRMEKDKAIRDQIQRVVSKELDIEEIKNEKRISTGLSVREESVISEVLDQTFGKK